MIKTFNVFSHNLGTAQSASVVTIQLLFDLFIPFKSASRSAST